MPAVRVLVIASLVALACGPPPERKGPEYTLTAFQRAVEHHRLVEAWGLMSSDYKKGHDRAAFERALAQADARITKLGQAQVRLEAEVALPNGEKLPLVLEDGAWKIARDPLDFYPQSTPAEALRSFARAVEARRWDVLARFVPARYRATVTPDKLRERWEGERRAELLQSLERVRVKLQQGSAGQLQLSSTGEEAELPLPEAGEHKQARLVREDGLWRIESLE